MNAATLQRTTVAIALALTAFLSLTPSGNANDTAPAAYKGDGGKVRLLANPAGTNSFIPFVIKKYKLDAKYGFELQMVPAASPQAMLTAVQAGGAEIGNVFWSDIARWRNAGVKVVGISPILAWADFAVVPEASAIRTFADLKGRKLGVTSRNSLNFVVMRATAQRNFGFDLEKEATIHEGSVSLLRGLMEQGQLDATEMYNSLAPAMFATGKFRPLAQIRELIVQLGLPDAPFLLYMCDQNYAAAHPANVRAFLAAFRETIEILKVDDAAWLERGREMKLDEQAIVPFRDAARKDLIGKFSPSTEADIRKTFDLLLATAGTGVLGLSELPAGFMTLEYQ
jgi:ABC-type nitrate/sulfonate/bicarbonate transport system substrate-binding protein